MKRSSKKMPCPFCGRSKDADCAWTDDVAFCHSGSDLRIGQTVDIDGQPWILVKLNGGFSGAAAVFKPHQENERYPGNAGANRLQILDTQARRAVASVSIERFFTAFDRAWNVSDFHSLNAHQLREATTAITSAEQIGLELNRSIATVWREHHDLRDLCRDRFDACLQNLKHQVNDLRHFRLHYLGEVI